MPNYITPPHHRARAQQLRLTSHPLVRGGMAAAAALAIGAPVYAAADAPAPMVSEFARLPSVQLEDAPTVSGVHLRQSAAQLRTFIRLSSAWCLKVF